MTDLHQTRPSAPRCAHRCRPTPSRDARTLSRRATLRWAWLVVAGALALGCSDGSDGTNDATASAADAGLHGDGSLSDGVGSDTQGSGKDAGDGGSDPLSVPADGYRAIFLDIGQGDATLLITASGETLLVDSGPSDDKIIQRLVALGLKRLDAVLATHADADHIAGLAAVIAHYDVKTVYWNGLTKETKVFKTFYEAANKTTLVEPKRGSTAKLGNLTLEFLHPAKGNSGSDHNADSLVVLTGCSGAWLLLTGDAEADTEDELLKAGVLSDVDVLKVAHHGSASGTTTAFLKAVTPEHAVISAGLNNKYDHPDKGVLKRLADIGAKIYQTDDTWEDDSQTLRATCKGGLTVGPLH